MPDDSPPGNPPPSEIILYQTEDGRTRVQCRFPDETIWLTQALIAELFEVSVPNVSMHLKALYEERELDEGATIQSYLIVRREGSRELDAGATCKDYLQVRSEGGRERRTAYSKVGQAFLPVIRRSRTRGLHSFKVRGDRQECLSYGEGG